MIERIDKKASEKVAAASSLAEAELSDDDIAESEPQSAAEVAATEAPSAWFG